jgi:hypothetical protein
MISKPFIALLILALTSSVIAATITPLQFQNTRLSPIYASDCHGQFLLGLVVREGLC